MFVAKGEKVQWFFFSMGDKVHIFWGGHKILRNRHQLFDWQYIGQTIGGDFAKFCGLLRIYELYRSAQTEHVKST